LQQIKSKNFLYCNLFEAIDIDSNDKIKKLNQSEDTIHKDPVEVNP